jgi:hypothetical protein
MTGLPALYDNSDNETHASSITIWLDKHPDHPEEYFCENQSGLYQDKGKSSHTKQGYWPESPNKRQKLGEVSGHSMNARSQRNRRTSPRKDARNTQPDASPNPKGFQNDGAATELPRDEPSTPTKPPIRRPFHLDQDTTPKPKSFSSLNRVPHPDLSHTTALPEPPRSTSNRSYTSSPTRSASSQASDSHASDTRSTRARSPVKRMGDFQLSNIKIEMKDFGHPDYPVPIEAKGLVRDLRRTGAGRGVIPWDIKPKAMKYLEDIIFDDLAFADLEIYEHGVEDAKKHEVLWEKVLEILDAARECRTNALPESAWNAEVHSRLLRAALSGYWHSHNHIWYRDISTAKITDASLLPTVGPRGGAASTTMQSKMVDYALIIDPNYPSGGHGRRSSQSRNTSRLSKRIAATLRAEGKPSINATATEHVRFEPIAVSFETKRAAIDEDDAHVQLGMWAAAHFARLRQLVCARNGGASVEEVRLPILPLVIIQGHDWKMMVAEAVRDQNGGGKGAEAEVGGYNKVVILRDLRLGSTDTVLGIYQLVQAVRVLAEWAGGDYRRWLESEVLLGGDDDL